ncbi:unnamed protein product [Absidia cylindrospora]
MFLSFLSSTCTYSIMSDNNHPIYIDDDDDDMQPYVPEDSDYDTDDSFIDDSFTYPDDALSFDSNDDDDDDDDEMEIQFTYHPINSYDDNDDEDEMTMEASMSIQAIKKMKKKTRPPPT